MGLPLFIAPVESDLPSKSTAKNSATSPSRAGIRRGELPNNRERRAISRRNGRIYNSIGDSLRQQSAGPADGHLLPWVESGFPTDRSPGSSPDRETLGGDGVLRPRPFREVLRELARSDDRRRERVEEQMSSLFGDNWQEAGETPTAQATERQDELGWWTYSRPQYTSGQMARLSRQGRNDTSLTRPRAHPVATQPNDFRTSFETESARRRRIALLSRESERRARGEYRERRRNLDLQYGVDGLGDRERSLSPERWNTLLTTLTPDPQPPSAGSSFASNVASQSAGVSSSTSLSTPDVIPEGPIDPACDSGRENSDNEDTPLERFAPTRPTARRASGRRSSRHARTIPQPPARIAETPGPDGHLFGYPPYRLGSRESTRDNAMDETTDDAVRPSPPLPPRQPPRYGWIGQLSVGVSDDERGMDRPSPHRESSTTSANNTSLEEEEWTGMQRIVRSLARREDIPDEWWTEAGLSRMLPPGAGE
ncbi:hypothetical protein G7046_g9469 [Stylonectria norvegica]|nr:hypothetical protein G7046_g9469 [Stylonectria norvegica]